MKIRLTSFGARHFDKNFGSTKILDKTIEEFHEYLDEIYSGRSPILPTTINGYAPFCKLLPIRNFTNARVGSIPITLENYQYIRSGYSARRDGELPVFSRWLDLPLGKPRAEWLMLVLYSREQLEKEAEEKNEISTLEKDVDYGIVAILGQSHPNQEPMKPETMIRNALGIQEGGSGVELNREEYLKSVEFWEKNATVK